MYTHEANPTAEKQPRQLKKILWTDKRLWALSHSFSLSFIFSTRSIGPVHKWRRWRPVPAVQSLAVIAVIIDGVWHLLDQLSLLLHYAFQRRPQHFSPSPSPTPTPNCYSALSPASLLFNPFSSLILLQVLFNLTHSYNSFLLYYYYYYYYFGCYFCAFCYIHYAHSNIVLFST